MNTRDHARCSKLRSLMKAADSSRSAWPSLPPWRWNQCWRSTVRLDSRDTMPAFINRSSAVVSRIDFLSSKNYLLNPSERMITTPKRTLDEFADRSRLAVATDTTLIWGTISQILQAIWAQSSYCRALGGIWSGWKGYKMMLFAHLWVLIIPTTKFQSNESLTNRNPTLPLQHEDYYHPHYPCAGHDHLSPLLPWRRDVEQPRTSSYLH